MFDFELNYDENIITEEDDVTWVTKDGKDLDRLVLTNQNIMIMFSEKESLFAKPEKRLVKIPLADVRVVNGKVMVSQVKNWEYGPCLQVHHLKGKELFYFPYQSKKNAIQWVNEICMLLGYEPTKDSSFGGLGGFSGIGSLGDLTDSIRNVAEAAVESVSESAKQFVDEKTEVLFNGKDEEIYDNVVLGEPVPLQPEPMPAQTGIKFCPNCGAKLTPGAKFCAGCGSPVGATNSNPPIPPHAAVVPDNPPTRQQEYAGTVLKCPACGEIISQTAAVCPACGHHITGRGAVNSVQRFSDQLMALESRRKEGGLLSKMSMSANPTDKQKLALIRSFPIPNTIDDIQEFMMLAIANIDVKKSKNSIWNKLDGDVENEQTIAKIISDAWVSKMKQTYQKALVAFPNDPAFSYIRQLYVDKMKELKFEIDD